jgi:hypothetical protein
MPRRVRLVALAVAGLLSVGGVATAGCGSGDAAPAVPLAMMRNGSELIVFIGRQCDDAGYPTRVRVANYDRGDKRESGPPLWEVETTSPTLLPSVSLGRVPVGFTEVTNTIAGQTMGPTIEVEVDLGQPVTALFDVGRLSEGRVLQSTEELVSLESFRRTYGCD